MNRFFTFLFLLAVFSEAKAQPLANSFTDNHAKSKYDLSKVSLNGQWRGSWNETTPNVYGFFDKSRTKYVLELEVEGSEVKGYSYTYFNDPGNKRYYTICRITGSFDRRENSIVVREVERVKYNTPPNILNCFQIHSLHYVKGDDNTEYLRGDWVTAPNQPGCSGKGETELSRQVVSRAPFGVTLHPKKNVIEKKQTPAPKKAPVKPKEIVKAPKKPVETKPLAPMTSGVPADSEMAILPKHEFKLKTPPPPRYKGYEDRKNNVLKTITIDNPVFQIDLYDNGEIDGDSISVFYNGRLILSHKKLTDKPISLTLSIDKDYAENVITMYAENLGTIPPNTALMIVRDGDKRYEVRMESDLGKSGTVIFKHDPEGK